MEFAGHAGGNEPAGRVEHAQLGSGERPPDVELRTTEGAALLPENSYTGAQALNVFFVLLTGVLLLSLARTVAPRSPIVWAGYERVAAPIGA